MYTFLAGESRQAKAVLSNPTPISLTYEVELYLGLDKAATSGKKTVTVPGNGSGEVLFPVSMPLVLGIFDVYLQVNYEGQMLKLYQATEKVEVTVEVDIVVGPITWT